jgi:hypothetical protein
MAIIEIVGLANSFYPEDGDVSPKLRKLFVLFQGVRTNETINFIWISTRSLKCKYDNFCKV